MQLPPPPPPTDEPEEDEEGPPACIESEYCSCMSKTFGSPAERCTCFGNIDTRSCDSGVQAAIASYVAGGCQDDDDSHGSGGD